MSHLSHILRTRALVLRHAQRNCRPHAPSNSLIGASSITLWTQSSRLSTSLSTLRPAQIRLSIHSRLPSASFSCRSFSTSPNPNSPATSQPEQQDPSSKSNQDTSKPNPTSPSTTPTIRENIYTLPNFITLSRIISCAPLGWAIVNSNFHLASGLVIYAGITDFIDGFLARRYGMKSVMGTILDPAADKILMTTLTVSLAANGMLPVPLAVIILGRDVLLSMSAFYYRYISLPEPKTFMRYWDFSIPSAEVRPTLISKVNTALQLALMTTTVFVPILPWELAQPLQALQWVVAGTTIWSGFSYVGSKTAVKILSKKPPS